MKKILLFLALMVTVTVITAQNYYHVRGYYSVRADSSFIFKQDTLFGTTQTSGLDTLLATKAYVDGVAVLGDSVFVKVTADSIVVNNHLIAPILENDTSYVITGLETVGQNYWDEDNITYSDVLLNGVIGQRFQELHIVVKNQTGSTIDNFKPVMYDGVVGASGRILADLAIADGTAPARYILGITTQDIINGEDGYVTSFGKVRSVNTTGTPYSETWADGDEIFVSPTIAGYLTNIQPDAPNQCISVGYVIDADVNGTFEVRLRYGNSIQDATDVNGTALTTTGQILVWNEDSSFFDANYNINSYVPDSIWDNINSAARLWGGMITDNGDGSVAVAEGAGMIKSIDAGPETVPDSIDGGQGSSLHYVHWAADASVTLTDDAYNYIYFDGTDSTIKATTNFYSISFTQDFTLGRAYRDGTDITVRLCGTNLWNFNRRVQLFGEEVFPVVRGTGLLLSETGTRNIAITAGVLWTELVNRFSVDAFNSSTGGTFSYWYRSATPGQWTQTTGNTQINNLNYDDGDGTLGVLTASRYGVHWVYVVHDGTVHVVYGQGDYTLTEAQEATPPATIPGLLSSYATLVGKIIIQKSASVFTSTESAFTTLFQTSGATVHNDLSGLQGGTTNEYYHLTEDELLKLQDSVPTYVEMRAEISDSIATVIAGSGDNVSVDGVATTDPDFVSTGDIDFVNTSNVVTANIKDSTIEESMLNAVNTPTDEYFLTYEAATSNFEWVASSVTEADPIYAADSTELKGWTDTGTRVILTTDTDSIRIGDETETPAPFEMRVSSEFAVMSVENSSSTGTSPAAISAYSDVSANGVGIDAYGSAIGIDAYGGTTYGVKGASNTVSTGSIGVYGSGYYGVGGSGSTADIRAINTGIYEFKDAGTVGAATSGYGRLYGKTDSLYFINDGGEVFNLIEGGGIGSESDPVYIADTSSIAYLDQVNEYTRYSTQTANITGWANSISNTLGSGGHVQLLTVDDNAGAYGLGIYNDNADDLFEVLGDGKIYMENISGAVTDTVLYFGANGLITKGLKPAASSVSSGTSTGQMLYWDGDSWEPAASNVLYNSTSGHFGFGGANAVSNAVIKLQKDVASGWAAWFDNGSTSGNGVLIQGGNGGNEYALRVDQESGTNSELFGVRGSGDLYATRLSSATADSVLYISAGLITKGPSPAGGSLALGDLTDVGTAPATTTGQILVANGTSWNSVTMSGDGTFASTGALTVSNDSHSHTASTISGLSTADFTSANVSQWTNDANYADKDLANTFAGDVSVPDEAYGVGWNGSLEVPTKNAMYDKIEALVVGGATSIDDLTDGKTTSYGLFLGSNAGVSDDGDNYNIGIGVFALNAVTSGAGNTAIGVANLQDITTGADNTAIGNNSLFNAATTTSYNTALGSNSLYSATGNSNTAIGAFAGDAITTGQQNIIIGYNIDAPLATDNGQIVIGNLIYGIDATGQSANISSSGKIGIKDSVPDYDLDVNGQMRATQQINKVNAIADQTTSFSVDASLGDVHSIKLTSTGNITITINNAIAGSQGTIIIYNASDTGDLTVAAYSGSGTTGPLDEITIGSNTSPGSTKYSTITYTATGQDEDADGSNDIILVFGVQP